MARLDEPKDEKCNVCQRTLEYGMEAIQVQHVICGPRGLIPLGEAFVFCSDECHESYFNGADSATERRMLP